MAQWQTPEELEQLLTELVSWQSRSWTEGERIFPHHLMDKLTNVPYFRENSQNLTFFKTPDGREGVNALYLSGKSRRTIVLLSHFDTVNTEDYGHLENLAFHPQRLTETLHDYKEELPEEARGDLESGEYLFGRGVMDMKMGLTLHMSIIARASEEQWPVNILLVTVPDEEVDSAGMREAVPAIRDIQHRYDLDITLFLNSEPTFQELGDEHFYMYSGSIGKIMPAALLYGKETHVGNPMSGLTANYMATFLTQKMEWNPEFRETEMGESTPLPISLRQKDLMGTGYSTQTPYRAQVLFNAFLFKRSAKDIFELFRKTAEEAAEACNSSYEEVCRREDVQPLGKVEVMEYRELLHYAERKLGKDMVRIYIKEVMEKEEQDDREVAVRIVDKLILHCQELGPVIILLFATPYYPAVNSSEDPVVMGAVDVIQQKAKEAFDLTVTQVHYFNGISDLSYVNYNGETEGWKAFERNSPVWGERYTIPFEDMEKLRAPVMNLGPYGKDAHKRTERLHKKNAFQEIPVLLETLIDYISERD
ncbi:amino acid degradation protein [Salimicrobium jeotgali]|uniref:Amino acid degradation n=1 Tax=Salimicrobium jeotgali TaxID=1230341 RepID=K2GB52_9BACI|nr:M20/M25/M40 family metallo-hydrolase [Salimicrobium jeotgali]AKG04886.1 amino acid degradation protein [Salimicrobium jeotgali]EKE31552.1 amino acid degradation [Salimicrobium jeotgali]MBM7696371.1 arginine utilization protein RocB [Salimicrobium jeotgali]